MLGNATERHRFYYRTAGAVSFLLGLLLEELLSRMYFSVAVMLEALTEQRSGYRWDFHRMRHHLRFQIEFEGVPTGS
jgi:hypothetical protein